MFVLQAKPYTWMPGAGMSIEFTMQQADKVRLLERHSYSKHRARPTGPWTDVAAISKLSFPTHFRNWSWTILYTCKISLSWMPQGPSDDKSTMYKMDISIAHVIIIIKSEVYTFPNVIIVFRGCVPEMFVNIIFCHLLYIRSGRPGNLFSSLLCTVYDECKYSDTFWLADRTRLFV